MKRLYKVTVDAEVRTKRKFTISVFAASDLKAMEIACDKITKRENVVKAKAVDIERRPT